MDTKRSLIAPIAFSLLASCGGVSGPAVTPAVSNSAAPTSGAVLAPVASAPAVMVRGYAHRPQASLFRLGNNVTTLSKQFLTRSIGQDGVFAVHEISGMAIAVPYAGARVTEMPSLFQDPEAHNRHTVNYFVQAGLPKEQVAGVHTNFEGLGGGSLDEVKHAGGVIHSSYYSVLRRSIDGIPVPDSFAFARFANDGSTVTEGVHWPAIPQATVNEAKGMLSSMNDAAQASAMRARLPQGNVQVVIRHSSFSHLTAPTYHASFDVMVSDAKTAPHLQHFDATGAQLKLDEKLTEESTAAQLQLLEKGLRPEKATDPAEAPVFSP